MRNVKQGLLAVALVLSQSGYTCTQTGSEGFVPENNLKITTTMKRFGGLSEAQFNAAIDKVETIYAPVIASMGAKLNIIRKWEDATVNAYAQQAGKEWKVSMFGGLARHETITEDGMSLVVCHEIGHHIGGAPQKASMWASSWASNEGQADYWATLKCLRKVWLNDDNEAVIAKMEVPETLTKTCDKEKLWSVERAICIRGGMAGDSVARLFAALAKDPAPAKFETPSTKVVTKTDDNHPASQCRLDTYFQGALCEKSFNEDVSNDTEVTGTCHGSTGQTLGLRPLCWFKPKVL
jgi:hypothetical protein